MSVTSKYNKGSVFNFSIPKDFEYESLADLFNNNGKEMVYKVNALYINKKSKFGDSPIVATDNELVNLPKHMVDTVSDMMKDDELIEAVNKGKVGFTIYPYETKNTTGVCYSVSWVDID